MKSSLLALPLVLAALNAEALSLKVVDNYGEAHKKEIWSRVKADTVPEELLQVKEVKKPNHLYSKYFPKSFLQDENLVVCYQDCKKDSGKITAEVLEAGTDWDAIEQANIYFWLKDYFAFLEKEIGFKTGRLLSVMTNRIYMAGGDEDQLKNNAFYLKNEDSLSFLPASKSFFFKLMKGKINRSGFDPSVIIHEASHFVFNHLYSSYVNLEISGVNEGFADYMANAFLNNPKIGLVMLHGGNLRDSSSDKDKKDKVKVYEPGLESHALGERVALSLWKIRELVDDKSNLDRMIFDAIFGMRRNPYATVHDFKEMVMKRLPLILEESKLKLAEAILEGIFPGKAAKMTNLKFLELDMNQDVKVGFSLKETTIGTQGGASSKISRFGIMSQLEIQPDQLAQLVYAVADNTKVPYWVVIDPNRKNISAVIDSEKNLIISPEMIRGAVTSAVMYGEFGLSFVEKSQEFIDLINKTGKLNKRYKITDKKTSDVEIKVNGAMVTGKKIELNLRARLIPGIFHTTPMKLVTVYTVDLPKLDLSKFHPTLKVSPALGKDKIIGFSITGEDGDSIESMIEEFN